MCRFRMAWCFGLLALSTNLYASAPYVGEPLREIKSLSQQEVEDYLGGKGMGVAKVAELNGFPGPRHVLDSLFREGVPVLKDVKTMIDKVTRIRGQIRFVHIEAHIELRKVLTDEQVVRYDELRGHRHHH